MSSDVAGEAVAGPRLVAVLAALIPVCSFVVLDPGGWYPFGPAKWFAVSVVVAAAVAVGVGSGLTAPRLASRLWAGLLALIVLSAVLGLDRRLAWLGTAERHLGVLAWTLFFGCFAVGASLPRRAGGSDRDVGAVVAGVVVATGAAGAYVGWEMLVGRPVALAVSTERLGGPFGSAAYLGAAMCLGLPVAVGVAVDDGVRGRWRIAAGLAALSSSVALLGSGTRGAWLGIGAATVVVGVRSTMAQPVPRTAPADRSPGGAAGAPGRDRRRWLRRTVAALAALSVIAAVVAPRLDDLLARDRSMSRLDEWEVAAKVIADRPLLGAGPEGYRLVVGGGIDADYELAYGREVAPDRAHSAPLDVAAVAGVPAALLYVALLVIVAGSAARLVLRARALVAGVGAAVVAYAVQQLVLFPVAELDVVFWLLAGIAVTTGGARLRTVRGRVGGVPVVQVAWVLVAIALFGFGLTAVAADRLAARAVTERDPTLAIDDAKRAVAMAPDVLRTRLLLAALEGSDGTLTGIDRAIDTVDRALDWSDRDPIVRRRYAGYLSRRAEITGDAGDTAHALAAWVDLVADDPNCAPCQLGLGAAAALAGDVERARAAWTQATRLTDDPLPAGLLAQLDATDDGDSG